VELVIRVGLGAAVAEEDDKGLFVDTIGIRRRALGAHVGGLFTGERHRLVVGTHYDILRDGQRWRRRRRDATHVATDDGAGEGRAGEHEEDGEDAGGGGGHGKDCVG
jgi:hypothetical protein